MILYTDGGCSGNDQRDLSKRKMIAAVSDEHATYFGTELADDSLVPGPDAELAPTTYEAWAKESA